MTRSTEVFGISQMPEDADRVSDENVTEDADRVSDENVTEDGGFYYPVISELARGKVTTDQAFDDMIDTHQSEKLSPVTE